MRRAEEGTGADRSASRGLRLELRPVRVVAALLSNVDRSGGRKAGELLLETALARASAMDIETLYLLTNSKCVAAIRLYEKLGFRRDKAIMARYGAGYARCDVAMRYRGPREQRLRLFRDGSDLGSHLAIAGTPFCLRR